MITASPILLTLSLLLAPPESGKPSPAPKLADQFAIQLKKPKDRVVIRGDAKSVRFDVTSPSGIGQAIVRRKEKSWPKELTLRLHLKGLEQITISNGPQTLTGSVLSHGQHKRLLELKNDGKTKKIQPKDPMFTSIEAFDADGKATNEISLKEGYFQLRIPPALLKENPKQLTIRWIDFYRS